MPRNPTVPCAQCGRLMWSGTTSLPPGRATCRPCRALAAQAKGLAPRVKKPPYVPELRACKRCGEMFEANVPSKLYCNAECREAGRGWGARPPRVASASERGYGKEHREARAKWKKIVQAQGGINCCLCGLWVEASEPWHLDHTPERDGYRGVAHVACNVRDGAIRGNKRRDRPTLTKACAGCGGTYTTIYPKQAYCSRECRPRKTPRPRPTNIRRCVDCGQPIKQGQRCRGCARVYQRDYARNQYRIRAGIPLDVPKWDRTWRAA